MSNQKNYTQICSEAEHNSQLIELSNEQLKTISGGVLYVPPRRGGRPPSLPLPRPGGGIQPATEAASIASIIASFII